MVAHPFFPPERHFLFRGPSCIGFYVTAPFLLFPLLSPLLPSFPLSYRAFLPPAVSLCVYPLADPFFPSVYDFLFFRCFLRTSPPTHVTCGTTCFFGSSPPFMKDSPPPYLSLAANEKPVIAIHECGSPLLPSRHWFLSARFTNSSPCFTQRSPWEFFSFI